MATASRPRIIIADDHAVIADAFARLLANEFEVIATVHDGRSLISAAQTLQPDVIPVDIGMPLLNGLEAAKQIKGTVPEVKVIYITVNRDEEIVEEALRRGASGYLSKTATPSELVDAIHSAMNGKVYVSPICSASKSPQSTQSSVTASELTPRQMEVLQLLAEGKSVKEAAAVLNVSTRTARFHKWRIRNHLHLGTHAELVQWAVRHRVIFD